MKMLMARDGNWSVDWAEEGIKERPCHTCKQATLGKLDLFAGSTARVNVPTCHRCAVTVIADKVNTHWTKHSPGNL